MPQSVRYLRPYAACAAVVLGSAFGSLLANAQATAYQPPPIEQTTNPLMCEMAVKDQYYKRISERQKTTGASESTPEDIAWQKELYRRCTERFAIDTIAREQLPTMASLYLEVQEFDSVDAALMRYVATAHPDSQPAAMGKVLWIYTQAVHAGKLPSVPHAGRFLATLDTLSPRFAAERVKAYATFLPCLPLPDRRVVLDSAVATARRMTPEQRTQAAIDIDRVYVSAMTAAVQAGRHEEAQTLRAEGLELAADAQYSTLRSKGNSLWGQQAPPIRPDHWINPGADSAAVYDYKNRITLIQYTATWCTGCRLGYPIMIDIAKKYPGVVRPMLVTYLEGTQGGIAMPEASVELGHMQKYWIEKTGINFPIAVAAKAEEDDSVGNMQRARNHPMIKTFGFSAMPTYVVVDRHGIIRFQGTFWTPYLKDELNALVERVLAEGE